MRSQWIEEGVERLRQGLCVRGVGEREQCCEWKLVFGDLGNICRGFPPRASTLYQRSLGM